jgi:glycosyltransferase involved in cell wall biosynthesis
MLSYDFLFSVIVPTFNRADEIKELLDSLSKQTIPHNNFEIIIVDDGSTDNTKEVIESIKSKFDLNIRTLYQNHKGPGEARNLGMKNAKGKYFVFIDSDCIADKNWLSAYKKEVEQKM